MLPLPPHPPAEGCDELLNAWCSACCPSRAPLDPLYARKLTQTEIKVRGGGRMIFWGCFADSELRPLEAPSLASNEATSDATAREWASNQCGVLSEREPGRYKSHEQRLLEFTWRKCVATRRRGGNTSSLYYAPIATSRERAVASFKAQCAPLEEAQAARRALAVAQGRHGFPYPPAQGCDERLNAWCASVCPPPPRDDSPLLARMVVANGRWRNATVWSWGCMPRTQLLATGAPRYARLRRPGLYREREGFCGNYSRRGEAAVLTTAALLRARGLLGGVSIGGSATMAASLVLASAGLGVAASRRPVEQRELAKLMRLCAASKEARELKAELLRKPLLVPAARAVRHDGHHAAAPPPSVPRPVEPPACGATAYVSVLTYSAWGNTFMARMGAAANGAVATNASGALQLQWAQLVVLVASLRAHERCARDFVLLLGQSVPVPAALRASLVELRVTVVRITPLDPAVPPLDHLHAWRLTAYRRVAVLDSDMLAIRPLDALFDSTRTHPADQLIMGHHAYDKAQRTCGLPVGSRGNGGLLLVRPELGSFEATLLYVMRGLTCGRGATVSPAAAETLINGVNDTSDADPAAAGGGGGGVEDPLGASLRSSELSAVLRRVQLAHERVAALEATLLVPAAPGDGGSGSSNESSGSDGVVAGAAFLPEGHRRGLLDRPCFKEEQTGLACYYTATRRLRVLPCPFSWDVGNELHMVGKQHHNGCLKKSRVGEATCSAIAAHVAERCVWARAAADAHLIHWKGKNKPWKKIAKACDDVVHGRLLTSDDDDAGGDDADTGGEAAAGAKAGGGDYGGAPSYGPTSTRRGQGWRPVVAGVDRLLFGAQRCRLRTPFDELGVGAEVRWATGGAVNSTCCDDLTLLRAEWWHTAAKVRGWSVVHAVLPGVQADQLMRRRPPDNATAAHGRNVSCVAESRRCAQGLRALTAVGGTVCVAATCGFREPGPLRPGAMKGCSARSGARDRCCAGFIQRFGDPCCRTNDVGCVLAAPSDGRTS